MLRGHLAECVLDSGHANSIAYCYSFPRARSRAGGRPSRLRPQEEPLNPLRTPSNVATVLQSVPEVGQLVRVRDRHWVVTRVEDDSLRPNLFATNGAPRQALVALSSVDDDALEDELEVIWDLETDREILVRRTLPTPIADRFDDAQRLGAFLDAVRWGAVASADARTLQAPFRSGISIEDYQLDPVVRALEMPRVNLLVADDVGLGKTIEAGLVVQELLLRHRARTVLVLCPPALRGKWQSEMLDKFGLAFEILDSERVRRFRRERGVGEDVFRHFPRVIASYDWLKDDRPLAMLRATLPTDRNAYPRRFDFLIVDEVHQCAPSGAGEYATDSLRTRLLRLLSPHVEHRLFLSATPHNGYESSYSALLELLDPQRFARGVRPDEASLRRAVVRRLKSQIDAERSEGERQFPKRIVRALAVRYEKDERQAHADLEAYVSRRRAGGAGATAGIASDLITLLLKKRLFSSPAAFAHTLDVHLRTLASRDLKAISVPTAERLRTRYAETDEDFDDDSDLDEAAQRALLEAARAQGTLDDVARATLERLQRWAQRARSLPDAKADILIRALERWCRPLGRDGKRHWNDERVILFTEYRDTQKWLAQILIDRGLAGDGGKRLALLHGGMDPDDRDRIVREFQHDPQITPVRILLATDTASEGIDLQRHCRLMVHIEIPFNPNRLEQRNGRIDRHGQTSPEVRIYHFVGRGFASTPGSLEGDLEFLSRAARKIEQIRADLGDVGAVLAGEVERAMLGRPATLDVVAPPRSSAKSTLRRMEEGLRERIRSLRAAIDTSIAELGISPAAAERVVRVALELAGQTPLEPTTIAGRKGQAAIPAFAVPELTRSWSAAASGLYDDISKRRLPVTFDHAVAAGRDDVVLAHLGHRLVAQALRLLRAEMWSGSTARLSRVSGALVADTDLGEPTLIAHARLVIVGTDGVRLHEELMTAGGRLGGATGFARYGVGETAQAQEARRVGALPRHHREAIAQAWPTIAGAVEAAIDARGGERRVSRERALTDRATRESEALRAVLEELRAAIVAELGRIDQGEGEQLQLFAAADESERRQFEFDRDALRRRVAEIPEELARETERLRARYADPKPIVFPAALEFLVPARFAETTLDLAGRIRR
jgi:superfamily II DNA or RNA helicase